MLGRPVKRCRVRHHLIDAMAVLGRDALRGLGFAGRFPHVHAKPGAASKHRYPGDDALCLWNPRDPPDRRWTSDKGLLDLIEIVRRHLFLENYWRATGGHRGGQWLVEDAPHGLGKAG